MALSLETLEFCRTLVRGHLDDGFAEATAHSEWSVRGKALREQQAYYAARLAELDAEIARVQAQRDKQEAVRRFRDATTHEERAQALADEHDADAILSALDAEIARRKQEEER